MVDEEIIDLSHIYSEGIIARKSQAERTANPYLSSPELAELWDCGWTDQNIIMTRGQICKGPYDSLLAHSDATNTRQDDQEDSDENGEIGASETCRESN